MHEATQEVLVKAVLVKAQVAMKMYPSVGRIVHYKLSDSDAHHINRRRTTGNSIAERIKVNMWPVGAQAHIGNSASAGDILPLIVVRVWDNEFGEGIPGVNGQVLLDANDQLWITSAKEGSDFGQWSWPPRT